MTNLRFAILAIPAFVAALGAIENSYAYGAIGALLNGQSISAYAACEGAE